MKYKLLTLLILFFISPWVQAAELISWKSYLGGVMLIALVIATFLSLRNEKAESRMAKIILAGLYFWVITFAELTILAVIYHFSH